MGEQPSPSPSTHWASTKEAERLFRDAVVAGERSYGLGPVRVAVELGD